jgi:hypothetical protein
LPAPFPLSTLPQGNLIQLQGLNSISIWSPQNLELDSGFPWATDLKIQYFLLCILNMTHTKYKY